MWPFLGNASFFLSMSPETSQKTLSLEIHHQEFMANTATQNKFSLPNPPKIEERKLKSIRLQRQKRQEIAVRIKFFIYATIELSLSKMGDRKQGELL